MNILVTNDDGIEAAGLQALVKELKKVGKVYVCAPNTQRSCSSISLSIHSSLQFEKRDFDPEVEAYALYGTPADCARMGLLCLFKNVKFDIVVSGINHGFNGGNDILYSGTVGAAREAFMDGVVAMAVSVNSFKRTDFTFAAEVGRECVEKFVSDPHNREFVLNVNVPDCEREQCLGYKACDIQGTRVYDEGYFVEEIDGKTFVSHKQNIITDVNDPNDLNVDTMAIKQNYITVSAVGIEALDHRFKEHLTQNYQK